MNLTRKIHINRSVKEFEKGKNSREISIIGPQVNHTSKLDIIYNPKP